MKAKPVVLYRNDKFIKHYRSIRQASKKMVIAPQTIKKYILSGEQLRGFKIEYGTNQLKII